MRKKKTVGASPVQDKTPEFEQALKDQDKEAYVLRLYVSGMTTNSRKAIENVRQLCEEYLEGHCHLEIIDIYQQPLLAREGQILAAPTLVKELPPPLRRLIGDLSQKERILAGLDIRTKR